MVSKWETIEKKHISNFRIFDAYRIKRRHPEWNKTGEFVVLDSPQWVNIIPVTISGEVVFIEQYRHGVDAVTLEVPGGLIEAEESPRLAGQRECTEETGYSGPEDAVQLGENMPNPAFLNNSCFSYVWFGCEKLQNQQLDGNEDINVVKYPMADVRELILSGRIRHSLVLTAFFFYSLKYGGKFF